MAIRITGMSSGLDTDAMVKELVSAYNKKGETYTKAQTKMEWKQEAWTDLNKKVKSFFSKYADTMRYSSAYAKKKTNISDSSKASVVTSENAVNGTQTLQITNLAKAGYLTGGKLSMTDEAGKSVKVTGKTKLSELGYDGDLTKLKIGFGEKDAEGNYANTTGSIDIDGDTTVAEFVKMVNSSSSGISANFDEANGRIFIGSTKSGVANDFHFEGAEDALKALGLFAEKDADGNYITEKNGPVRIDGENAKIVLNGAEFESDTNSFTVNGLSITAKDLTTGSGITLTTDVDYEGIYDKIKEFFKEYNSLINEMSKLYNADNAKDYEPLTSEEKEEMTDEEVEKWEGKIKDALLRRDSDLNKIMQAMENPLLKTYQINGKTYSLSSFGINTLGYFNAEENERNAYHIDGDEDDTNTSSNVDKLKSMIASNPEDTAAFFQKLIGGLYTAMNDIQRNSDTSTSYGSFYSDKLIKSDITDQKKKVSDWESKVADIEEKYYKQFSAMEKAMTQLNSQQTSLAQMLGGGQ